VSGEAFVMCPIMIEDIIVEGQSKHARESSLLQKTHSCHSHPLIHKWLDPFMTADASCLSPSPKDPTSPHLH
jgi:hypothetical protein